MKERNFGRYSEDLRAVSELSVLSTIHVTKQILQFAISEPRSSKIFYVLASRAQVLPADQKQEIMHLLQKELQKEIPYTHCLSISCVW